MSMKRELIASRGIWTAKKRYMLSVRVGEDDVFLKEPETKMVGLETKRSSHPQVVRDMLERCIEEILNGNEDRLQTLVASFREKFYSLPAEKIAYPRGCKSADKWAHAESIYRRNTPIAARASLVHNHWIETLSLSRKYAKIREGDKMKFIYLKMPNPIKEDVIGFIDRIPTEFRVDPEYIDYDTQFEKTFLDPLTNILSFVGWTAVPTTTLDSFFA
jgi:DNA polymerase elongation subunit (family B)